jgi:hypothetical protein
MRIGFNERKHCFRKPFQFTDEGNAMREKFAPWIPAVFCAFLSFITVFGNLVLAFVNRDSSSGLGSMDIAFYCFLPMSFFFVGAFLSNLRKEQLALRQQLDALSSVVSNTNQTP